MADIQETTVIKAKKEFKTILFNPFHYIAGGKALLFGLIIV